MFEGGIRSPVVAAVMLTAALQLRSQRQRGEHVPAGAARGDDQMAGTAQNPLPPGAPRKSDKSSCGRLRVSASSMPIATPAATREEPP